MLGKSIYFFYKALLFGVAAYAVIPRTEFKRFLIYGFIFGAIGDVLVVFTLDALGLIKYHNMGPFGIWGIISFWTPIAWMFAFMIFFYFLPVRTAFLVPYIIGFSLYAHMVGLVLSKLGLYEYVGTYRYSSPLIFAAWFSIAAYVYFKVGNVKLRPLK